MNAVSVIILSLIAILLMLLLVGVGAIAGFLWWKRREERQHWIRQMQLYALMEANSRTGMHLPKMYPGIHPGNVFIIPGGNPQISPISPFWDQFGEREEW